MLRTGRTAVARTAKTARMATSGAASECRRDHWTAAASAASAASTASASTASISMARPSASRAFGTTQPCGAVPAAAPMAAEPEGGRECHDYYDGDGHDTLPGTAIRVFRTVDGLRAWRRQQLLGGRTVGLVPTMGALHAGHLDLVRAAARDNDDVVVSIYVNPTQFGVHEDLGSYPRTWEDDSRQLAALDAELGTLLTTATTATTAKPKMPEMPEMPEMPKMPARGQVPRGRITAVFAPTTAEMYPSGPPSQAVDGPGSFVTITPVGARLEGASRPTFFRGVATVCMKLFHIVQPERAYFGQKDVQQTVVLQRMVRDFCIPLTLVVGPTVREPPDGLALSSRNMYLGTRRRRVANVLRRALLAAAAVAQSSTSTSTSPQSPPSHDAILAAAHRVADETLAAQRRLPPHERALFEIDYLSLSETDDMAELAPDAPIDPARGAILSGAVRMLPVEDPQPGEDLGHSGGPLVRLIDNIVLPPTDKEAE